MLNVTKDKQKIIIKKEKIFFRLSDSELHKDVFPVVLNTAVSQDST